MTRSTVKGPLAFTASNNTELETYDSSFVDLRGNGPGFVEVQSNKLTHTFGAAVIFPYRDATPTYSADQYAGAVITWIGGFPNARYGVACRMSADSGPNDDWYAAAIDFSTSPVTTRLYKCVNGTVSTLDSRTSIAWASGDALWLEAVTNGGNCELTVYRGAASQYTYTDSSSPLTSGKPGMYLFDNAGGGAATMDDWEAGDITGSSGPTAALKSQMLLKMN